MLLTAASTGPYPVPNICGRKIPSVPTATPPSIGRAGAGITLKTFPKKSSSP
jgi:hypothetical protein